MKLFIFIILFFFTLLQVNLSSSYSNHSINFLAELTQTMNQSNSSDQNQEPTPEEVILSESSQISSIDILEILPDDSTTINHMFISFLFYKGDTSKTTLYFSIVNQDNKKISDISKAKFFEKFSNNAGNISIPFKNSGFIS